MKTPINVAALIVAMAASVVAQRALKPTEFTAYGGTACTDWLKYPSGNTNRAAQHMWLLGWVSAAGKYNVRPLKETNGEGIELWVTQYCQQHPIDSLPDAATALVLELAGLSR